MSHQVPSAQAVRSRAATPPARPVQIINGWPVDAEQQPINRFASVDDYIAAIEEAVAKHPRYRDLLFADDWLLSFGTHYRWMWKSEQWCKEYPFRECIERAVASLAEERRLDVLPITPEDAHLFELFGVCGS